MKKVLLFFIILYSFLYSQSITEASLPLQAKNFINLNLEGDSVDTVSLYQNGGGYEVNTKLGFNIIFYQSGLWKSIKIDNLENNPNGIPRSCIHRSMVKVIDNEYPSSKIISIIREDKFFTIVLNDNVELQITGYGIIVSKKNLEEQ